MGSHYIEGGWPGSNPTDIEFFAQAKKKKFKNARLAAFGSTRRKGVAVEQDDQVRLLIEAGTPVVTIYGKTSMLHVKEVLRCTPEENLAMIGDTVRYLKGDHGKYVVYDAEHALPDGYKLTRTTQWRTWQAAEKAGADYVVCSAIRTAGVCRKKSRPSRAWRRGNLNCKLGIHTHDDIGLGVANALAALGVGADHVQGTINGYGERTGNCNLTSTIPCIALKLKKTSVPEKSLPKLKELSQFVDEIANLRHNPRQPWVGSAAFSHKGGTHVNAVQKLASSYEHIDPSSVGNARTVLVSDLAGRSNIVMKAQELGFKVDADTPELKTILSRIKELENQGYEFEAAEGSLALLIGKTMKHREAPFQVETYHVSMRRDAKESICEATVRARVGKKVHHEVAEGDGPVNALDGGALRAALMKSFPQLKHITLTDYKVRILDSATGTAAQTRVLIQSTDGKREWGTVGVSGNIIEASLQALTDSMEFALLKK